MGWPEVVLHVCELIFLAYVFTLYHRERADVWIDDDDDDDEEDYEDEQPDDDRDGKKPRWQAPETTLKN